MDLKHRVTYGEDRTIHRTGTVDIIIDPETGEVTSVWFRCCTLPFTVHYRRDEGTINPGKFIDCITYTEEV